LQSCPANVGAHVGPARIGPKGHGLMLGKIRQWRSGLARRRLLRRVIKSLALNTRGEVRADGLSLKHLENRLTVEWCARRVHPWSRFIDIPREDSVQMFAEQCLDDANAALERLFSAVPDCEVIDFKVLHPQSGAKILEGTVTRSEVATVSALSAGMKLKKMGVRYHLSDWRFESLS